MTVELRNLHRSFGGVAALDGVSLTIGQGEFLALLGPSGSGKTTLLRVLAGLEFLDAGEVTIDGRRMDGVPARERGVGLVFQHYALFRHMTVARNVAFGLEVLPRSRRPARRDVASRVRSLLEMMQIGELGDRYPEQISGGQRQRVALARALAIEPRLLLLDEPFGALDARVRKSLRIWLRELHERMGLTSVFVTHDQAEAMEMADRVAVLRAGQIEQVDEPDRLYAEPASAFVHEFLGEAVRFEAVVEGGTARIATLPGVALDTDCPAGPAIVLIRPHEIRLRPGPGPAQAVGMHANGPLWRVRLALPGQVLEVLRTEGAWRPEVGQTCDLDLSRARVYPANSMW
ncbi:MAG TPA: ATP-binding cassette domain-containing protein [Acetobacteraceae bacterium]|nr:ATP-binding cassette domain-containing protein [Acetobacteraceae bacterium]